MPTEASRRAPVWLFDLDNTLHDADANIFPHINRSMTEYVQRHLSLTRAEADALRQQYWNRYGATLSGLVRHHGVDPRHFLAETHRFNALHEMVVFERALKTVLRRLPGRKIVFSNAPRAYIETVLATIGIHREFAAIAGIEALGYQPKPAVAAYRRLLHRFRLDPRRCVMVDDNAANLAPAKRLGMRTVLVGRAARRGSHADVRIGSVLALRRTFARLCAL